MHLDVSILGAIMVIIGLSIWSGCGGGIKPFCSLGVAGEHGDFVGVVDGEVGVDEDQKICNGLGERERVCDHGPGAWIGVEDDGEKGSWLGLVGLFRPVGGVYGVHVGYARPG